MPDELLGFTMTVRANNGSLIPLYPKSIKSQVLGWNIGEIYGPYTISLPASGWSNSQQVVSLPGVVSTDTVECVKVLTGDVESMTAQDTAYKQLRSYEGIQSLNGQIRFYCTTTPSVDLTVQVHWTR